MPPTLHIFSIENWNAIKNLYENIKNLYVILPLF